jgi:hypothetical protein
MREELEELRKTILATKIIEKEYGVFLRYPKGYEGSESAFSNIDNY